MRYLIVFLLLLSPVLAHPPRLDQNLRHWEFEGQPVEIPHTWNGKDAFQEGQPYRRGAFRYQRRLNLSSEWQGRRVYLVFEGANQVTTVWLNGSKVGTHRGGYTGFQFDITDKLRGSDLVVVEVDNRYHPDLPPLEGDFNFYGGLYRPVRLVGTAPVSLAPEFLVEGDAQGRLRARGWLLNHLQGEALIRQSLAGTTWEFEVPLHGEKVAFEIPEQKLTIKPWSPSQPRLYPLTTEVWHQGQLMDRTEVSIGFRSVAVDPDRGFLLNGEPLQLVGANRHQDRSGLGNALEERHHHQDLRLLKEAGCNFVRLAHYPQACSLLEEADRLGLLIWEEIPIVNRITNTPAFFDQSETMLVEMVHQHYRHPSVVMWGYMNEVTQRMKPEEFDQVTRLARRLEARVKKEDPARLTAIALSGPEMKLAPEVAGIPDILGFNLYYGWYYGNFADLGRFLDDYHRDHPHRPLFVSEYGAGSDERVHSQNPVRFDFSVEHQQNCFHQSLPLLLERPYLVGSAVWNGFDFGSWGRQDTRPTLNQKGLFFFDRRPKDVAYYFRALLSAEPFVRLDRERLRRKGEGRVSAYTNQPKVELFHRGRSLGWQDTANGRVSWEVDLEPGLHPFTARSGGLEDSIVIEVEAGTAINCGASFEFIGPERVWSQDSEVQSGEVVATKRKIAKTDLEPLFQTARKGGLYQLETAVGPVSLRLLYAGFEEEPSEFPVKVNGRVVTRLSPSPFQAGEAVVTVESPGLLKVEADGPLCGLAIQDS